MSLPWQRAVIDRLGLALGPSLLSPAALLGYTLLSVVSFSKFVQRDAAGAQSSLKMALIWIYPSLFFILHSLAPILALRNYPENEGMLFYFTLLEKGELIALVFW